MKRAYAAALAAIALVCSCASTTGVGYTPLAAPTPPFNANVSLTGGCWARLYERAHFGGRVLTIAGPARVADLPPHWGFPWDPRYESLSVGPGAVVTLFDDPTLRTRTSTFKPAVAVADLDHDMGLFRRIRSVSVTCVPRGRHK